MKKTKKINVLILVISVFIIISVPVYYLLSNNKKEHVDNKILGIEEHDYLKQQVIDEVAKLLSDTSIAIRDLTMSNVGFLTGKQKVYYFKSDCEKLRGRFNSLRDRAESAWDLQIERSKELTPKYEAFEDSLDGVNSSEISNDEFLDLTSENILILADIENSSDLFYRLNDFYWLCDDIINAASNTIDSSHDFYIKDILVRRTDDLALYTKEFEVTSWQFIHRNKKNISELVKNSILRKLKREFSANIQVYNNKVADGENEMDINILNFVRPAIRIINELSDSSLFEMEKNRISDRKKRMADLKRLCISKSDDGLL